MSDNHTIHPLAAAVKAPLYFSGQGALGSSIWRGDECISCSSDETTARRIAAALNAVEGIPTVALEHGAVVGLIDAVTNAISRLAGGRTVGRELTPAQLVAIEDMLWAAYHATYQEETDGQSDER